MTPTCTYCTALGSDGLPQQANQEEILAHAELHRQQVKYYDEVDSDFPDKYIKGENDGHLTQNPVEAIQKRKVTWIGAYCRELFSSIQRRADTKLECAECGQKLMCLLSSKSINSGNIACHAMIHLKISMYTCNHCDFKSITKQSMFGHTQQIHLVSGTEHYKDLTGNHRKEICRMIKKCFGRKSISKTTSVHEHMVALYRAKWWKQSRIRCNQCGQHIRCQYSNQPRVQKSAFKGVHPIDHACIHLGRYLYSCRQCTTRTVTDRAIRGHLRKAHCLSETKQNFVSTMDANRDDIIEMIDRCFGLVDPAQESVQAESVRSQKDIILEHAIRSRFGENKLLADRQIHSQRLMTKFSKSGMITCRVCSHEVNIMQQDGLSNQKAIWHASTHVQKPLYRCRRCQKNIHVMSSVYRHMKKEHGITKGVAKEYDDFSDDLHLDLVDALTRSFDWSNCTESKEF